MAMAVVMVSPITLMELLVAVVLVVPVVTCPIPVREVVLLLSVAMAVLVNYFLASQLTA